MTEVRPMPQTSERPLRHWRRRIAARRAQGAIVRNAGEVERTVRLGLWLPLTPLWLLLAPVALLLAPALAFVPALRGINPYRAAFTLGALLIALSGTVVEVDAPGAAIRLRIF